MKPLLLLDNKNRDLRIVELRRMRLIATLLLVGMTLVFIFTSATRLDWPFLPYLRAFTEAGMVGACADWFAVVALFRRPLGLPIPHTAVVPNNKQRIGGALGRFITNNFLSTKIASQRLAQVDTAGWIAHWIADQDNAATLARSSGRLLFQVIDGVPSAELGDFLGQAARRGVEAIPAAPLASKVLSVLWARGEAQDLLDRALDFAEAALMRHKDFVIRKVSEQSSRWVPKWIDNAIAAKVMNGLLSTIKEMHDPGHPWRRELAQAVEKLIADLATDADLYAQGEAMKADLLASPLFVEQVRTLWREIDSGLHNELAAHTEAIVGLMGAALRGLGGWLQDNPARRARLNRQVRLVVLRVLLPRRAEIGAYIADVVENWDAATLVNRLELQVGKDLQYIRINGTLVGGLVGLLIFVVAKLIPQF
jgi:uncharacterized membrane-anchored protein YjiN (DUF445 family)